MADAKISYDYFGINPSFSTATQLRDALLAAYPDAEFFRGPITGVRVGYDIDAAPAWGWLKQLLRTRTDWWPAVGIAVQHAAQDGGEMARQAVADLLATCEESAVLLEWTEPVAAQWPDTRTSASSGCNVPDARLADLVARQHTALAERERAPVAIPGLPERDAKTAEELESLLTISLEQIPEGPWYWLVSELIYHPWIRPLMPAICEKFSRRDSRQLRGMLDWLFDQHDLWRHFELLDDWSQQEPAWWNESLNPGHGYRNPLRMKLVPDARILGHLVWGARKSAVMQRETPPIVDLPANPSFGGPARAPFAPRRSAAPPSPVSSPLVSSPASADESSWGEASRTLAQPPALPPSPTSGSSRPLPSPSSPSTSLARGSLGGDGFRAPTPAITFAQHHAAIVQLLVLDETRVASVDRDRVALIWDPQTAAVISRLQLLPNAILYSLSSTQQGVAYVTQDADGIAAHTLATAIAVAAPFVASRHGNQVLRWDLRTRMCSGAWTAPTTLTAIDIRADGAVLTGEANGVVTVLRW